MPTPHGFWLVVTSGVALLSNHNQIPGICQWQRQSRRVPSELRTRAAICARSPVWMLKPLIFVGSNTARFRRSFRLVNRRYIPMTSRAAQCPAGCSAGSVGIWTRAQPMFIEPL
eukprot:7039982-Alexandrium_andersonii.AAC.1